MIESGKKRQGVRANNMGGNQLANENFFVCMASEEVEMEDKGVELRTVRRKRREGGGREKKEKKGVKHGEVRDMGINLHGVTERAGSLRPTESLSPNWSTF